MNSLKTDLTFKIIGFKEISIRRFEPLRIKLIKFVSKEISYEKT